ncbi:MAG TPA: M42 family peptidase, partial [Clostridia bacterium]|nr:M42 family peptidase [Clostridia bacterium]
MLGRLEELTNIYGVSGDEGRVRKYLKGKLDEMGLAHQTDTMGNLIVHKEGKGRRVMVCAHMDEVGMIVRGILDNGLIAYEESGLDARVVISKRVVIGRDDVSGVIGAKAIHLQSRDEFKRALPHSELYVDIGAKDKQDAQKYVKLGDRICFTTKFERLGDAAVKAKALDDRVGCAILLELLKNDYACDLWAVFTVQEEVGLRGAKAAVWTAAPDVALVLEGTTANDMPKARDHEYVTRMGNGPAITFMDGGTVARPRMFNALQQTAKEAGIP